MAGTDKKSRYCCQICFCIITMLQVNASPPLHSHNTLFHVFLHLILLISAPVARYTYDCKSAFENVDPNTHWTGVKCTPMKSDIHCHLTTLKQCTVHYLELSVLPQASVQRKASWYGPSSTLNPLTSSCTMTPTSSCCVWWEWQGSASSTPSYSVSWTRYLCSYIEWI